jgi:hypothetical protein
MVKKISVLLIGVALVAMASTVSAGNHKEDLMHCGCVAYAPGDAAPWGTAYLEWTLLNISKKGFKGHQQHEQYDYETCVYDLTEAFAADGVANYYRGADDCAPTYGGFDGIEVCVITPQDGDLCDGPPPPPI